MYVCMYVCILYVCTYILLDSGLAHIQTPDWTDTHLAHCVYLCSVGNLGLTCVEADTKLKKKNQ